MPDSITFPACLRVISNVIVVKPAVGFTLPWGRGDPVTPAPSEKIKTRDFAPVRT